MDARRQLILQQMLAELKGNCLTVLKLPSRYDGYIRIPITSNCEWYRTFCAEYQRYRRGRDRTYIKRCHTISALHRMLTSKQVTPYVERLESHVAAYTIHFEISVPGELPISDDSDF